MNGKSIVSLGKEPEIFYKCNGPSSQEIYSPGETGSSTESSYETAGMAALILG